ncbi:MAG: filamentous hemagglutinin N-terminal domain-containing protein, partial [Planctomycetota bacterium]
MERARKISKKYYLRQIMACWLSCWMLFGIPVQVVMADPSPGDSVVPAPGNVISSSTTLDWTGSSGLDAVINTATGNNITTWNNFDIGKDATLTFTQNGGWMLNNVQAGDATGIFGGLFGPDCGLIVVNPQGVVFGPDSLVNAQNFIASSLQMSSTDFTNGVLRFTDGDIAGDVTNNGTILAGHMAALIGKNVYNRGHIAGEYVIMAAGETVLITESSAVVVEVALDGDPADYEARNEETIGDYENNGSVDTKHVILAAGDVWSAGIEGVETLRAEAKGDVYFDGEVDVYAEAASDAVADITIITGGDYTVTRDNEMSADAVGNGVDNATAKITIDAGGNVTIEEGAEVLAEARGGSTNNAGVEIKADGDVKILGDDEDTWVETSAYHGSNNNANIDITAGGKVDVIAKDEGSAGIYAEAFGGTIDGLSNNASIRVTADDGRVFVHAVEDGYTEIYANAHDGVDNSASVEVTAKGEDGDVKVVGADGGSANIGADAYYADNKNSANVTINADGDVLVRAKDDGWAGIWAQANNDDEENEAGITIIAGGNVEVLAGEAEESGGTAKIGAYTRWGFENTSDVTITAENGEVLVHGIRGHYPDGFEPSQAFIEAWAEYAESENSASVTITAKSEGCEDCDAGDVKAIGVKGGVAAIGAYAENSPSNDADVTINADGQVKVIGKGSDSPPGEAAIEAVAENWDLEFLFADGETELEVLQEEIDMTVGGLENTANVDITADNVEVKGEDDGRAKIEALARNEIDLGGKLLIALNGGTLNFTVGRVENTAGVTITAVGDVTADYDSGNVWVTAEEGGKAKIEATAENEYDHDSEDTVNLLINGPVENKADVVIAADDDVEVTGTNGNSWSVAAIEATAENEIEDDSPTYLTVDGRIENTAGIDITAGDNVLVEAGPSSVAKIDADAENDIDVSEELITENASLENKADVVINAVCNVEVIADEGKAKIEAETEDGTENTSNIAITTTTGDVKVMAEDNGDAEINAEATNDDEENKATITINAGGNVEVVAEDDGDAEIKARAWDGAENTASITINADGDVEVRTEDEGSYSEARIRAEAWDADNENSASVTINAGGDVDVIAEEHDSEAAITAEAFGAGDDNGGVGENSADVTIDATGNVEVRAEDDSDAKIGAG